MTYQWKLFISDPSDTTRFACDEFTRLIRKADPKATVTEVKERGADSLVIGLCDCLPSPKVEDATLDDGVSISVANRQGYITGTNKRSVLMAVYRFFKEIGAAYVRPGRDGERVPLVSSEDISVSVLDTPVSRYRGFCIEGSAGYEHIVDLIDFAPKLGMNIIFTQLWRPSFALNRWYGNQKNPSYVPAELSIEAQDMLVAEYDRQIVKRGLNHHKMGHGWIPSILGEKTGIWHGISAPDLLKEEHRHLVAEINGERKLHNDSAVDTSFCYGNPEARALIVKEIVKYAKENPETDTLHVWLADQPENQCECPLCRDTRPSDLYVDMLNELDEALTEEGLTTKVIFLSYLELLWSPRRARIKNPERFALIFAPIRRPYERPFSAQKEGDTVPFVRNKWTNPCDSFSVLRYFDEWKSQFPGDCMLFDYHLMWDFYNDLTGIETGKMFGLDMAEQKGLGFTGMISCQGVRISAIGALPMRLMANALWSGVSDGEGETAEFFRDTYGDGAEACRAILDEVRAALPPNMLRGKLPYTEDHAKVCERVKAAISAFLPTVAAHSADEDFSLRVSYLQLGALLTFADKVIDFIIAAVKGESDEGLRLWSRVLTASSEFEALYPKAFDAFEFSLVWHRHVLPVFFPNWRIDYGSGELTM